MEGCASPTLPSIQINLKESGKTGLHFCTKKVSICYDNVIKWKSSTGHRGIRDWHGPQHRPDPGT
jgi:hypothetical protein